MTAIEVEKKFFLRDLDALEAMAKSLGHRTFRDTYFDTDNYTLTSQSMWVRQRDDQFEFKRRVGSGDAATDRYEEVTGPEVAALIRAHDAKPFVTFVTDRSSYSYRGCQIDVDSADFGDFQYAVAEIELIVSQESQIGAAEEKILSISNELNLETTDRIQGKLIAYLRERRPRHFAHLVDCGAIRT